MLSSPNNAKGEKMALKPPMTDLPIRTADSGFYRGFSLDVTVVSKVIISALVVWAIVWPIRSGEVLNGLNGFILENFAAWYIWTVGFFIWGWPSGPLRRG
jgi:hypothetical protein